METIISHASEHDAPSRTTDVRAGFGGRHECLDILGMVPSNISNA